MLVYQNWEAIDAELRKRYGDVPRLEWTPPVPYRPMGPQPMGPFVTNLIAAYPRTEPVPHWHLIGYALTAPFEERGYEFTLRVPRDPGRDQTPPNWAMHQMERLASYVSRTGNDFAAGHFIEHPDPLDPDVPDSAIRAGGFVPDPELGELETAIGRITFLQFVGITTEELHAAQAWNVQGVLGALRHHLPMLITDLHRSSLAHLPDVAQAVEEGARREGSGTGYLFLHQLDARVGEQTGDVQVIMGAQHVPQFTRVLPGRIPHGIPLILQARTRPPVVFLPGEEFACNDTPEALEIVIPADAGRRLAAEVAPEPGDYRIPSLPRLTITVTP
ncbi:suppressor of fused domain protein [Thermomonospora catenispora]|uniref:suppressor of fused domain protein n=1 Tax=Thermomonospora catenispora TaxID=2493090 RepID=UPI001122D1CD|nr:suppressor of fused domain protein [Thermomonospora catenispora]TNY36110.1 suppressor of fused domain protein [Thermomonospora catenispora]